MYLVFGATGNVGGELVSQLHELGQDVRAFLRDPAKASHFPEGTQIAIGDLDDLDSMAAAAQGVNGVFFMQVEPSVPQAEKFVQVMRKAEVKKIVLLSSLGTHLEPKPMIGARIEARDDVFRRSGLPVTYLCPNALMSNALWWASSIREEGRVTDATDPGKTVPVDTFDVANVAALVLTENGHIGKNYILNGPEALSAREQTNILGEVLKKPIEFVAVTPEEYARQSVEKGTPKEMAGALQNLNELFRAGRAGVMTSDIENLTGVAPRTFREWCKRHVASFS
jgi:uncharacterized protein YbjT (DUF2867 family)